MGLRALVHKERHHSESEEKAWEGVLVGHDSDSPSGRMNDRYTGRIPSYKTVAFIEQAGEASCNDEDSSTPVILSINSCPDTCYDTPHPHPPLLDPLPNPV